MNLVFTLIIFNRYLYVGMVTQSVEQIKGLLVIRKLRTPLNFLFLTLEISTWAEYKHMGFHEEHRCFSVGKDIKTMELTQLSNR